jgi:hypothetical protein
VTKTRVVPKLLGLASKTFAVALGLEKKGGDFGREYQKECNMQSRTLTCITAMTLFAALAVSVRLEAQEQPPQDQQQDHPISDLGSARQATSDVEPTSDSVVPRLIQFSGTVKDAEGKPAVGSVELTLSLYQFHEGGSPLWVETQAAHLDSQGRYTVLLGAASPGGLPQEVFASGTARWLGVQPGLPGADEQPRVLLVGVPYALKAADAETLGGKPASAYVTTQTINDPGTAAAMNEAPTSAGAQDRRSVAAGRERKQASSASPLTSCSSVTADGTATANQVAKFTAACKIHQSQIFDNGTDVGIGTTTPSATLDVNGNISGRDNLGLPQTTKSTVGVITLGGGSFIHACCSSSNTFVGANAGNFSTTGGQNTAAGGQALIHNTVGISNTALGGDGQ